MAKKTENNTGFFVVGGIILVILLLIIFKKPKAYAYNSQMFAPTGGNSGGGNQNNVNNTNAILCNGANSGKVGLMQRALNRAFSLNLAEDNQWGKNTQAALDKWFQTFESKSAPTCLSEQEYNKVLNTY